MDNNMQNNTAVDKTTKINLNDEYYLWMRDLKQRFRNTQIKAAVKVNSEQLLFNWHLGRDLVKLKAEEKWGKGIVEQISKDLQLEFPDVNGFSARNLWYMKQWYKFYTENALYSDLIASFEKQLLYDNPKFKQTITILNSQILNQVGSESDFPQIFGLIPWRHHVLIIQKCGSVDEALFYIRKSIENNLSRSDLEKCISSDLFRSVGTALTNFGDSLPLYQGKMAQDLLKDNYNLGFISLPKEYDEETLEDAIEQRMTRFLLELGNGWAFVGRQKEIVISGKIRRIDLLFYHIYLRCYVVIELKVRPFSPEFAGKLNFYVNAVNEFVRKEGDNPTIGLLICRDVDKTEVQLAFQGITTPMGVATYENVIIKDIQEKLPTPEQFNKQIELAEEEFRIKIKKK